MRTGIADLPLHRGKVPRWLFTRMCQLAREITIFMVDQWGSEQMLNRLSDPFWFQSLGCVLGFDWHSSGVTTTVCGALKVGLRGLEKELGLWVTGGKGRVSQRTPQEIRLGAEAISVDGEDLVYASRMAAKVDSSALQDGHQIYHHCFFFGSAGAESENRFRTPISLAELPNGGFRSRASRSRLRSGRRKTLELGRPGKRASPSHHHIFGGTTARLFGGRYEEIAASVSAQTSPYCFTGYSSPPPEKWIFNHLSAPAGEFRDPVEPQGGRAKNHPSPEFDFRADPRGEAQLSRPGSIRLRTRGKGRPPLSCKSPRL